MKRPHPNCLASIAICAAFALTGCSEKKAMEEAKSDQPVSAPNPTVPGMVTLGPDAPELKEMKIEPVKNIQFIDITEQRNLAQQFKQQEQQKQKQLMQATIDGQERERSEISRELHDNISQHLTTTRLYLEVAKDKTEGQPLEMIMQAHKGLMYVSNEITPLIPVTGPS